MALASWGHGAWPIRVTMFKYVALIRDASRANRLAGLPIEPGGDVRERMPSAGIVVILGSERSCMLMRYTMAGEFSGDTWHASLADALHHANDEFGVTDADWAVVPDAGDPIVFAREHGASGGAG